jgi:CO/xanthine dehydrogenase FAD-binding subunit
MILAYHRPRTLEEALRLIGRPSPRTLPLGGGTLLSRATAESIEVVDLQALGLGNIRKSGKELEIGATATLAALAGSQQALPALKTAIGLEAPLNLRNAGTVAGALVSADGRSTFAAALLALDAKLTLQPNDEEILLGNCLPLREQTLRGKLITSVSIPLQVKFSFDYISRTPADKPIACVALAQWPSGRTRVAVGGYGKSPLLAMDGTESEGIETAARNAFHEADDEWGSAEYRMDVAATLARRCMQAIQS